MSHAEGSRDTSFDVDSVIAERDYVFGDEVVDLSSCCAEFDPNAYFQELEEREGEEDSVSLCREELLKLPCVVLHVISTAWNL